MTFLTLNSFLASRAATRLSSSCPVAATSRRQVHPGLEEHVGLVAVAVHDADVELLLDAARSFLVLLDGYDLVLLGDVSHHTAAQLAGTDHYDPHHFHPIIFWNLATLLWRTTARISPGTLRSRGVVFAATMTRVRRHKRRNTELGSPPV